MPGSVLIVVDVQNDFLPGGALAVPDAEAVIGPINALARCFEHVVLTQDWHPRRHVSFATSHPGRVPHDCMRLDHGREQILWPEHCLQGSRGAALADRLRIDKAELVIRKGYRLDIDSYSAFAEADDTPTGLAGYLHERGIARVVVAGLATDFCAGFTAIDAAKLGFDAMLVEDACRGIDAGGSMARTRGAMLAASVAIARMSEIMTG